MLQIPPLKSENVKQNTKTQTTPYFLVVTEKISDFSARAILLDPFSSPYSKDPYQFWKRRVDLSIVGVPPSNLTSRTPCQLGKRFNYFPAIIYTRHLLCK